jgi:hypothetical protein
MNKVGNQPKQAPYAFQIAFDKAWHKIHSFLIVRYVSLFL